MTGLAIVILALACFAAGMAVGYLAAFGPHREEE